MSRKYKLVAAVRIEPNVAFWVREAAGSWSKIPVTAGLWYILGDGTGRDLLDQLEDDINAALPTSTVTFSVELSAAFKGRVQMTNNGPNSMEMRRTDPASSDTDESQALWDELRWGTTDVALNGSGFRVGSRVHGGGLYPEVYVLSDEGGLTPRVSQSRPDEGNPQTLNVGRRAKHFLGVRLTGSFPRNDTAARNDYHAMQDLMDNYLAKGRPFRFYPDRDVTAAYDEGSEQYGYSTYVLDQDSMEWRPDPAFGLWYNAWDTDLEMWTYTGTDA